MVHDEGNRLVGVLRARTVEELKSEKAFNGRLFNIFWMRTRTRCIYDIFPLLLMVHALNFYPCGCPRLSIVLHGNTDR